MSDKNPCTSDQIRSFPPIASGNARILILGSMPGVASLNEAQYYAHPRNSFWRIISDVFDSDCADYNERCEMLTKNGIALWDVLKSCVRKGSLDANIQSKSIEVNDFNLFFKKHQKITRILLNGKTAETEFRRRVLPHLNNVESYQLYPLPSTSPAMAMLNFEQKKLRWSDALK